MITVEVLEVALAILPVFLLIFLGTALKGMGFLAAAYRSWVRVEWEGLDSGVRYFGAIQHYTEDSGPAYDVTLISVGP